MGSSSGGSSSIKKKYTSFRSRQRANLSFFIVVMFFAVFGIIVFTEVFFIDDRNTAGGILVRHGYRRDQAKEHEYDEDIIENQLPPFPDNSTPMDGHWQNVNGTRYKFFVFSAFFDPRRQGQRIVRIIGATKTRGPERVWCRMWYKANDFNSSAHVSLTVPAKVWAIRENWNLKYSAVFVKCPVPVNKTSPAFVSVVTKPRDPPTNLLFVNHQNDTQTSPTALKFGICVKPLHFDYNREMQILEFIELNRLLGVEHFTFYNHTIGPQVSCLLRDYIEQGVVSVLPWQLDMVSQKEIRTEGLFAALNDCLYRSMWKFSHILLIDLDEFIIPKYNDTLPQLVDYLHHRFNMHPHPGSLSFQNAFFYLQWDDDPVASSSGDPIMANLVTLRKTRRRAKLHPHKQRSKYICRPEVTVEAGNHFVWELMQGFHVKNAPSETAILHHYRICEFGGNDCIKTSSTVDKTAYRYKDVLTSVVREHYYRLKPKCNLSELKIPKAKGLSSFFNNLLNR